MFAKLRGGGEGPFFLLNNRVIRIFCLKNCLTILRAVTYLIRGRMCSRAAKD